MLEYNIRSQRVAYFKHVARRKSLEHGDVGIGRKKRGSPRSR